MPRPSERWHCPLHCLPAPLPQVCFSIHLVTRRTMRMALHNDDFWRVGLLRLETHSCKLRGNCVGLNSRLAIPAPQCTILVRLQEGAVGATGAGASHLLGLPGQRGRGHPRRAAPLLTGAVSRQFCDCRRTVFPRLESARHATAPRRYIFFGPHLLQSDFRSVSGNSIDSVTL